MAYREIGAATLRSSLLATVVLGLLMACVGLVHFDDQLSAWHAAERRDAAVYRLETGLFGRLHKPAAPSDRSSRSARFGCANGG